MKKIIVGLVILMPIALGAALSNGGGMGNWKSKQDSNGDVVFKTLAVDGNGTPIPTPSGGSGSAVVVTNTTPIPVTQATPTPGIQPVSPTAQTAWKASGTLTVLTSSSQALNVSSAAGANVACNVHFRAVRGGTSVVGDAVTGVTYSALTDALNGPIEVVTGASDKIYGPCWEPGTIIPLRASGTASVTLGYMVTQCK